MVAAFLEEAGEVAPIDVARYGQRAGEIIRDPRNHVASPAADLTELR
jgi:hypothetical protein